MAANAMMTHHYKCPPNNFYVHPMKLKYGLEDSLWYSELIDIDLNVQNVRAVNIFKMNCISMCK